MGTNQDHEEDYFDMEVSFSSSSSSNNNNNFLCYSSSSSPPPQQQQQLQNREFEFQMMTSVSQDSNNRELNTTSPADELFYKGKLLPLHLPPRLLMVQNLLQTSTTTTTATPMESCNISPSESCRVSSELNPDEYFFEWSTEINSFIGGDCDGDDKDDQLKKSWTRKLKQMKKSSLISQKLKASKIYLKSLFSKSACSDHELCSAKCNNVAEATETIIKGDNCFNKYMRVSNTPLKKMSSAPIITKNIIEKEIADQDCGGANNNSSSHRRSFSGAIQRHCAIKCSSSTSSSSSSSSSSSFSFSSNGFYNNLQLLKRSSSSANIEIESSIEGAIAHCKQSQQLLSSSRKGTVSVSESGVCSLLASRMSAAVCADHQERPGLCSI